MLWTSAILRQQRPHIAIYYDHSPSSYQCSANRSIRTILRPKGELIRIGQPPEGCVTWKFLDYVLSTQHFLMEELNGMISESLRKTHMSISSPKQGLQQHMLRDAMFEALCPVVMGWWHLLPDVQAQADALKRQLQSRHEPVIAIHARGGDKVTELGQYRDPITQQYPMADGMRRLLATHPGINGSAPSCIIFSDDYQYARVVRTMAEDIIKCGHVIMRAPTKEGVAYHARAFHHEPQQVRCEATKAYLLDIELMGWATYLVANHRANADTIATFLRKCKFHREFSTVFPGTGAPRFTLWGR